MVYSKSPIDKNILSQDLFEEEWGNNKDNLDLFCNKITENSEDANEIFQRTAIRAWRGYSSFRGGSSFLTWVISIARNESNRFYSKKLHRLKKELSIESIDEENIVDKALVANISQEQYTSAPCIDITQIIHDAFQDGYLSDAEYKVLYFRIASQNSTQPDQDQIIHQQKTNNDRQYSYDWNEVGRILGFPSTTCATHWFRAISKIRVYLFINRIEMLGSSEEISIAFEAAAQNTSDAPLSKDEANAFRFIVLQHQRYSKAGWRTDLRIACSKVIRYLEKFEYLT